MEEGHGKLDLLEGLVHSCDVVFYTLGEKAGVEKMESYARKYGLNALTGIDLPGETKGYIPTARWKEKKFGVPWYPGDSVNMAIGQGFVQTTPIQMSAITSGRHGYTTSL